MENYSVGHIKEHVVLMDSARRIILFSMTKYKDMTFAGEGTLGDERLIIKKYGNNIVDITNIKDINLCEFTEELPETITKLSCGRFVSSCQVSYHAYIRMSPNTDYWVDMESDIFYETSNYCTIRYSNDVEFEPDIDPNSRPIARHVSPDAVVTLSSVQNIAGTQIIITYEPHEIYYITGKNLPIESQNYFNQWCITIAGNYFVKECDGELYVMPARYKSLSWVPDAPERPPEAKLSKDYKEAARAPGFGELIQCDDMLHNIAKGSNVIGNMIISSNVDIDKCAIFSTIDPSGREIVFGVGAGKCAEFEHSHKVQKMTKSALTHVNI